jgi:hypothetical protein
MREAPALQTLAAHHRPHLRAYCDLPFRSTSRRTTSSSAPPRDPARLAHRLQARQCVRALLFTRLVFCAALSAVLDHLPIQLQSTRAPSLTPDSSQLRQNTINDVLDIRPLFLQVHDRSSLFEARLVTPCKNYRGIVYGASLRLYVSNSQTR